MPLRWNAKDLRFKAAVTLKPDLEFWKKARTSLQACIDLIQPDSISKDGGWDYSRCRVAASLCDWGFTLSQLGLAKRGLCVTGALGFGFLGKSSRKRD